MKMILKLGLGICIGVSLVSCMSKKDYPVQEKTEITSLCEDFATLEDGIYKYENNTWGVDEDIEYSQCLVTRELDGRTQYGWSWNFAGKAKNWVYSYPEIIVGWKPWGQSVSTIEYFPVRINEVKSLRINYDVEISAEGSYNLAPEIWLIKEKPENIPTDEPQKLITTEIMFWMDYTAGATPAGRKKGSVELNGEIYDLWHKDDHKNSMDTTSWSIYSLVSREKKHAGTIDVKELIDLLISEGYPIDDNEYIADIEFGNEIIGPYENSTAMGITWINEYSVEFK